ncbi:MAG: energy-coupling factor ABC transporter ATP-binding protein [Treponema sp.]|nr:energy-coupling factor ABC transporter ATP-binding protein [Treponema sp.]
MIKVKNLNKSFKTFDGTHHILKNISLEIKASSFTVIAGENGAGKSVLMSIIAGLEKADSGLIETNGQCGLVFQEAETQILGETPREDIAFGPKNLKWPDDKIKSAIEKSLITCGLKEKADYPARFLSGGEKRRLAVGCMLAMDLPVIILDEPYANLDYKGVKQLNDLLKQLKKEKKTIIVLTHEIEKCLALCDSFFILYKGEKVFDGTAEEGLKKPLENWNIKNPLVSYRKLSDLVW